MSNQETGHFITRCSKCGKVIAQCRCPSKDKEERFTICDECKYKGEGAR